MSLESVLRNVLQDHFSEENVKKTGNPKVDREAIEKRFEEIIQKCESSSFDFSKMKNLAITQKKYLHQNKRRYIKSFLASSDEDILSICVKRIIDRNFKLRFPNRNRICKDLFNILPAMLQMSDFTIYRFDFSDYFNSVNSEYVFEKFIRSKIKKRDELNLLSTYVKQTIFAYAGLRPSNSIAEIIALEFDNNIKKRLYNKGLIFYERFIDDGLIIINCHISNDELDSILKDAINCTFHDSAIEIRCTISNNVKINHSKSRYISGKNLQANASNNFDFLGYSFSLKRDKSNCKNCIVYGITEEKRLKYMNRLEKFFRSCYCDKSNEDEYQNFILLEHRIRCFVTRQVYVQRRLKSYTWKVKGFIANYGELRYFAGTNMLEPETDNFLKTVIVKAFDNLKLNTTKPPFLNNYCLLENLKKNKTLLFVRGIGYDKPSLERLCTKVHINLCKKSYDGLVRDYLIKMKVGY